MMIVDLLGQLREAGILLTLDGDRLKIKAPSGALTDQLKELLKLKKEEIITFLQGATLQSNQAVFPVLDRAGKLPLSYNQHGLWFFEQLTPGTAAYTMPFAFKLHGAVNVNALRAAVANVMVRQESLRSRFVTDEQGVPHVVIDNAPHIPFEESVVVTYPEEVERLVRERVSAQAMSCFDLEQGPLFRIECVFLRDDNEAPLVTLLTGAMHHIISDGWSLNIFIKELLVAYLQEVSGLPIPLPPLTVQYVDYAGWQQEYLKSDKFSRRLLYWENHLRGIPSHLALPTDFPRPFVQGNKGGKYSFVLSTGVTDRFTSFCRASDLTLFMGLMAAWKMVMYKHSGQTDFCLGIPMAGRNHKGLENIVGLFIDPLIVRSPLDANKTLLENIFLVRQEILQAFDHQEVPLAQIVEKLQVPRNPAYAPIVQIGFQLQNFLGVISDAEVDKALFNKIEELGKIKLERAPIEDVASKFDMIVSLSQAEENITGAIEYNAEIFVQDSIARMVKHLENVMSAIVDSGEDLLRNLTLVSTEELVQSLGLKNVESVRPLTDTQLLLYMDAAMNPDTVQNSIGTIIELPFSLDVEKLSAAMQHVIQSYSIYRTQFMPCDLPWAEKVYQVVHRSSELPLEIINACSMMDAEISDYNQQWAYAPYNIHSRNLYAFRLYKRGDMDWRLAMKFHHIVVDGTSLVFWVDKLGQAYDALVAGEALPQWKDRYPEFIDIRRREVDKAETLEYWKNRFLDCMPLTVSRVPGATRTANFEVLNCEIDAEHTRKIQLFCKKNRTHPVDYFRLLTELMIRHYCRPEGNFIFNEVQNGRANAKDDTLGVFYQAVPWVVDLQSLAPHISLRECYDAMSSYRKEIRNYRQYSVLAQLHTTEQSSIFFQFNYFNFLADHRWQGKKVVSELQSAHVEKTVQCFFKELPDTYLMQLWCDRTAFDDHRYLERVAFLSSQIVDGGVKTLGELRFVLPDEQARLDQIAQVARPLSDFTSVVEWFERSVICHSRQIAVQHGDHSLTYAELNAKANRLARALHDQGIGKNARVAVLLGRRVEMLVAVLAILKANASYVPVEASYPCDRIQYILRDSGAKAIITEDCQLHKIGETDAWLFDVEADAPQLSRYSSENLDTLPAGDDEIYVIYTSGSTGHPKGASVCHRGEVNLQQWYIDSLALSNADKTLIVSAFGFDLTQKNLFAMLLVGGTIVLPEMDDYDDSVIRDAIQQHAVTLVNCAPSAFYPLVSAPEHYNAVHTLKWVVLGGEPIRLALLFPWLANPACSARLVNSYGPTECTDVVSYHVLDQIDNEQMVIPIGLPVPNCHLHIVDHALVPVAPGLIGELCVSGICVGNGYVGRPDLTEQAFVENPFGAGKLYKTGDLCRQLPDGTIEYIGRKDFQVKVRGLRIELGEIERALTDFAGVSDGLVLVRDDRLTAYIVASVDCDLAALRHHLRAKLPDYMVPSSLIRLDQWPLTPNGKVDRKALPAVSQSGKSDNKVLPRNDVERTLSSIWEDVLKVGVVGVTESFFDLGGHSLLATQIVSRVRKTFNVSISLRDMMLAPTVEALAEIIRGCSKKEARVGIERVSRHLRIPLSYAQQRLWILDKLVSGSSAYNVPLVIKINGSLDAKALSMAISEVVNRHEILRTCFREDGDGPFQMIMPLRKWETDCLVFNAESEHDSKPLDIVREVISATFDLSHAPLFRSRLLKVGEKQWIYVFVAHHIVTDGWSMGLFISEVIQVYAALSNDVKHKLPNLMFQYADFSVWQRGTLTEERIAEKLQYWKQELADLPVLAFPTDRPRPAVQTFNGAAVRFTLPVGTSARLTQFARVHGVTPFNVLLALFSALLGRYSGQTDFAIGTPVAGRNSIELESIVGFFVNTVTLRVNPSPQVRLSEWVCELARNSQEAFEHQEIPFEEIVDAISPVRDMSRSPLFQVMLVLQNIPLDSDVIVPAISQLSDLSISPLDTGIESAKYDLTLTFAESSGQFSANLQFNSDLFDARTLERFSRHFIALSDHWLASPERSLSEIELLDENERKQQLTEWNDTCTDYPEWKTVQQAFRISAQRNADQVAIRCGDKTLTYAELDQTSTALAGYLQSQGVKPGQCVGLCFDRSVHLMTSLLAIIRAGASYVPIDASYPVGRIAHIIATADISLVLSRQHLVQNLPDSVSVIQVDDAIPVALNNAMSFSHEGQESDIFYTIFTSGSTGVPKGAAVYQRSVVNLLHWYTSEFQMTSADNILLMSAIGFDLTQKNLWAPLIVGATLVIPEFQEYDPRALSRVIIDAKVTWLNCAPSAFYGVIEESEVSSFNDLRWVFLGGEPINFARIEHWYGQTTASVVNSYGPTECTDIAAYHVIKRNHSVSERVPIGRPNYNVKLYILGESRELLPLGAVGELWIGGDGLGAGYIGNPELTAQSFAINHLGEGHIYRTGDLARYLPNGDVEYLGRIDQQVKLRGYRIEVGEIQAVIQRVEDVVDCFVGVVDAGTEMLCAWLLLRDDANEDSVVLQIRKAVSHYLPAFMHPASYCVMDEFPLTPNGKIDRNALPKPELLSSEEIYLPPRNDTEERLATIWCEVLQRSRLGIRENFFSLGGHSLLATKIASRVAKEFGVAIRLRDMLETPTIEGMALAIANASKLLEVTPLIRVPRDQRLPLSYAQQRLWVLDRLESGTYAYNVPVVISLKGELHVAALQRAISQIVNRHEALRTYFLEDEVGPFQMIAPEAQWKTEHLTFGDNKETEFILQRTVGQIMSHVFDLSVAPLFRSTLVDVAPGHWVYVFVAHHIVTDGWSMALFIREVVAAYLSYVNGRELSFETLSLHYADFAVWQRQYLSEEIRKSKLDYWKGMLDGVPALALPTDRTRPPVQTFNGDAVRFDLSGETFRKIQAFSRELDTTPFNVLLSLFASLLGKYSGQNDFAIGSPVAGRDRLELEPIIGFFVNMVTIRVNPDSKINLIDMVLTISRNSRSAFDHQDIPFEEVVEIVDPSRDMSRPPLFQVMMSLQNIPVDVDTVLTQRAQSTALEVEPYSSLVESAKYEYSLSFTEGDGVYYATLQYNTDLFDKSTVERFAGQFCRLADAWLENPGLPLGSVDILTNEEKNYLLNLWNQTDVSYDTSITLGEAVRQNSRFYRDKIALVASDGSMSFEQIETQSNRWANLLRSREVLPGGFVGVCCDRTSDMVVALLAVLKAGCAYIPIDPEYPRSRIEYVINDAKPSVILTHARLLPLLPPTGTLLLPMDQLKPEASEHPETFEISGISSESLAYVIYTSGSTGNPKGVQIHHRAFMNFIAGMQQSVGIVPQDRLLAVTSLSFDIAGLELFFPLLHGAQLIIATREEAMDASQLVEKLEMHRINFMQATPATWHLLVGEGWSPALPFKVLCGGEPMPTVMANALVEKGIDLYNVYGPTETTVWSTVQRVQGVVWGSVPIGRPIANTLIYILDDNFKPVPVGVPGELYIGGDGVAKGYLNRPDLTEERFIDNPFIPECKMKIYRTGDLARYRNDGVIECLGRLDHQVKIRGFRIELGEIESVLNRIEGLKEGVVHPQSDEAGTKYLVAYYVLSVPELSVVAVREKLRSVLPDYMVPTAYVALESMPLTPNGKVDRKALPQPNQSVESNSYQPPHSQTEICLVSIWQNVLKREKIGIQDNFFSIGGHSLLATSIIARINKQFSSQLSVRAIFEYPTIVELAKFLETSERGVSLPPLRSGSLEGVLPLSYGQSRLWYFEQLNYGSTINNMPFALLVKGRFDLDALNYAYNETMRRHAILRARFFLDGENGPRLRIAPYMPRILPVISVRDTGKTSLSSLIEPFLEQDRNTKFNLEADDMLRCRVLELPPEENGSDRYVLQFCMHHIASDGVSIGVLRREILTHYASYATRTPIVLAEPRVQYPDFARWQREWFESDLFVSQLEYWESKLRSVPQLNTISPDYERQEVQTTNGDVTNFHVDAFLVKKIEKLSVSHNLTPFMVMLAAWKILVARYNDRDDVSIGVPTVGRHHPDLEHLIGFFVNSIIIRTQWRRNASLGEILEQVKLSTLDAFAHGNVPLDKIVESLPLKRGVSHTPIVQLAFQLFSHKNMHEDGTAPSLAGVEIETVKVGRSVSNFDITLSIQHMSGQMVASLEYNTDLYRLETIEKLWRQYVLVLDSLLGNPDIPVMSLQLESESALMQSLGLAKTQYEDILPLTHMQRDMFVDNLVNPQSLQSSHGWVIHLRNPLDLEAWNAAVQQYFQHYPLARARYVRCDDSALDIGYLAVPKETRIPVDFHDKTGQLHGKQAVEEWLAPFIYRPYHLINDDLVKFRIVKAAEDHYAAAVSAHHAIFDGIALTTLWQQLAACYNAIRAKQSFTFAPDIYREHIAEDRSSKDTADVLDFWKHTLATVEPLDFTVPPPVPAAGKARLVERFVSESHWNEVRQYCRKHKITPAIYFKCLYALLIDLYCRPDSDFSLQETMSGRAPSHAMQPGCYIQEVPFVVPKSVLQTGESLDVLWEHAREYQKRIKDQRLISLGAQARLSPRGRIGFMYNFYQFVPQTLELAGEVIEDPQGTPSDPANNVQFVVSFVGGRLRLSLYYHAHLFDDMGMLERLESLSCQIIESGIEKCGDLHWVTTAEEQHLLLQRWNDTRMAFDLSAPMHVRFERQAKIHPESLAIVDDKRSLTYAELDRYSNQFGHYLSTLGVVRGDLVGLCIERSCEFLIGVLGILKAGAAYVPMDAHYPQERITYMRENSETRIIVSQQALASKLGLSGVSRSESFKAVYIDSDWPVIAQQTTAPVSVKSKPTDVAYMLYTSGSTGLPKGALIRHDGALNHIEAERKALAFEAGFNFLQTAPASSDISVWQFLGPVTCGGTVVVLDEVTQADKMFRLVNQYRVNVVELVPVAWQLLIEHVKSLPVAERSMPSLKWLMATGEAVPVPMVNEWLSLFPDIPVVNAYGPTEAADDVIQNTITQPLPPDVRSVPIGKPLANMNVFIVDANMRLVPPGVPGEICLSGIGVGNGYWKNPEKTQSAFVPNPFLETLGATIYKTGDLGRWLHDGTVEYLDRVDNQVKIRGFRIELGEVEAVLASQPEVAESAVIVRHDMPGGVALVGYAVLRDQTSAAGLVSIRDRMRSRLPDYMVPAAVVFIDAFPTTPAGKIDKKALPKPTEQVGDVTLIEPSSDIERRLVQIWKDILHVDALGINSNFFDLGGHSLLATQIVARVSKLFDVTISVRQLMTNPTIEAFAPVLEMAMGQGSRYLEIPVADRSERIPLSYAQQRLWLLEKLEPGNSAYNVPFAIQIKGHLDVPAFENSVSFVINRHEGLRTCFREDDNGAYQHLLEPRHWKTEILDYPETNGASEPEILRACSACMRHTFSFEVGPLFRSTLIKTQDNTWVYLFVAHHIVTDGWSMGILVREVIQKYLSEIKGVPSFLPVLKLQYADFAKWQREVIDKEVLQKQLAFWKETLNELPPLILATDKARPAVQTFVADTIRFNFDDDVTARIIALAREQQTTTFNVLLVLFATVLARYSGQSDFAIGTPVAGRSNQELENIIGFFVNTVVLRIRQNGNWNLYEFLREQSRVTQDAFENQDAPFEEIVEAVNPPRDMSRSPLFQVMMSLQNIPLDQSATADVSAFASDIEISPVKTPIETTKYDITLTFSQVSNGLSGAFQFNIDLFDKDNVQRLVDSLVMLASRWLVNPHMSLAKLDLVCERDKSLLLGAWNNTFRHCDVSRTVQQRFQSSVNKNPEQVAVKCGNISLTYRVLDKLSGQLAAGLREHGVAPGDRVGLCLDRSLHLMTAMLSIIKAGATYVPIDSRYPEGRIRHIADNAGISIVLTRRHLENALPQALDRIDIDLFMQNEAQKYDPICETGAPDDLFYLIYTSGSTGVPKGAAVYQRSVINMLEWYVNEFSMTYQDKVLLMSAIGFDLTQKNLWAPLLAGATLVIPSFQEYDANLLAKLVHEEGITWINCAPSAFYPIVEETDNCEFAALRWVFLGGEPINFNRLEHWYRSTSAFLVNSYGPTECTDIASYHVVERSHAQASRIPIGRPNYNVRLYVLGNDLELLPIGAVGELCVAGDGVGAGYFGNMELTLKAFVENPFEPGKIMYRTGDLVRYLPGGALDYLGRMDQQVKLRGYRIEISEIQSVIQGVDGVVDCFVGVEKESGDSYLAAWVVAQERVDMQRLKHEIEQRIMQYLPDFMRPRSLMFLDRIPLTPNGKVDRKALPKQSVEDDFVPAQGDIEVQLAAIFGEVIGRDKVSVNRSFFELGGTSLTAVKLASRINRQFGTGLSIAQLLRANSVRQLATLVASKPKENEETLVKLRSGQSRHSIDELPVPGEVCPSDVALVFVHPVGGDVLCYRDMVKLAGFSGPIYGLRSPGLNLDPVSYQSFDEWVSHYADLLEKIETRSVRLVGQSIGGLLAYAIAGALMARNREVESVVMIDTFMPAGIEAWSEEMFFRALGVELPASVLESLDFDSDAWISSLYGYAQVLGAVPLDLTLQQCYSLYNVVKRNHCLAKEYSIVRLDIPVLHVKARENAADSAALWKRFDFGFSYASAAGGHDSILLDANARELMRLVGQFWEHKNK